jgi:D-serine deaminase-like pyridoxal phosphate-dependent protein
MDKNVWIGKHVSELDTPALLLDRPAMERNLDNMAQFLAPKQIHLRPHVKIHKATPEIARLQLTAGAQGLTCAKLSEAEALVAAGFTDVLIANQVVGPTKIGRLVRLARDCNLMVAVDHGDNVKAISEAAATQHVVIGALVEVNIGHNRCGVAPFEPALALARAVQRSPGLAFRGVMGYDGHCTTKVTAEERGDLSRQANRLLVATRDYIEANGLPVEIVSGAGTFTYRYAAEVAGITEVQAGTYLLMDTAFQGYGVTEFECTLSVLSTVISRPTYPNANGLLIIDAGRKSLSVAYGNPEVKWPGQASVVSLSDEHGRVRLEEARAPITLGDKVELWVRDANGTINQFDCFYVVRDQVVEEVWEIPPVVDHT